MKSADRFSILCLIGLFGMASVAGAAVPPMAITEWMYNGLGTGSIGEFVEFTNLSGAPIDMTGWSFDDSSRTAGSQSLSAFGTVQPNESVILTDDTATSFRTNWGLDASIKIIGGNANNLGRADEINLFDAASALADRLTYDDQTISGSPRTSGISGGPNSVAALGVNNAALWSLMAFPDTGAGDPYNVGTIKSSLNEIGNPGRFVPEPSSIGILCISMLALKRRRA